MSTTQDIKLHKVERQFRADATPQAYFDYQSCKELRSVIRKEANVSKSNWGNTLLVNLKKSETFPKLVGGHLREECGVEHYARPRKNCKDLS